MAREDAARDVGAEVSRRFRIGIGAGQVLRRERVALRRVAPAASDVRLSLAKGGAVAGAAPARSRRRSAAVFVPPWRVCGDRRARSSLVVALAAARLSPRAVRTRGRLYYFAVLNVALALGVAAGLAGHSRPVWARTART